MPATSAAATTTNGFGPPPRAFGRVPSCGPDGATTGVSGSWSVGSSPRARDNQTRLQLPQERGILGELLRELRGRPAALGSLAREILERGGAPLDERVAPHRRVGGSSPVAIRQICDAARRAASVAAAPRPA